MASLPIREIYRSIQGESSYSGLPCVFVRSSGCDIRCNYCDEPHAFHGGVTLSVQEIIERVKSFGTPLVEVTGGEPLLHAAAPELVRELLKAGFEVLVETGGHHDISPLDPGCRIILDLKTPGSRMASRNDFKNLDRLRASDEIKFVVWDRADYEWARELMRERGLEGRFAIHLSPVHGELEPAELAAWILDDQLRVRLNLQLHKYIWGDDATGV